MLPVEAQTRDRHSPRAASYGAVTSSRFAINANDERLRTQMPQVKTQTADIYSSVAALARQKQREDILNCFRPEFIESCFATRSDSVEVWDALKQSHQMHETIRSRN
jgi:hypothetical protein